MDHNLLLNLLNLRPEQVENVNSINEDGKVSYFVTMKKNSSIKCPLCDYSSCTGNGFYKKKVLLPFSSLNSASVTVKVRRYLCDNNHSFSDIPPLSPENSTISYDMVMEIMHQLANPRANFTAVAANLGISPATVMRTFDKYCHIEKISFPEAICIDEVYTKNTDQKCKYSCIFYDFFNHSIVDIVPSRQKQDLVRYLDSLDKKDRENVKYICMDMYSTYKNVSSRYFKNAIICVDSFHVIKTLNDGFDRIRVRIMKSYDTNSIEYYLLKKWKNLLNSNSIDLDNEPKYNKKLGQHINYRGLLMKTLAINTELKKAYELKTEYIHFNATATYKEAQKKFGGYIDDFIKVDINEYSDFVTAITNWIDEITNSFIRYKGRRINSSVAESVNAQVKAVVYNSKGIRDSERKKAYHVRNKQKRILY